MGTILAHWSRNGNRFGDPQFSCRKPWPEKWKRLERERERERGLLERINLIWRLFDIPTNFLDAAKMLKCLSFISKECASTFLSSLRRFRLERASFLTFKLNAKLFLKNRFKNKNENILTWIKNAKVFFVFSLWTQTAWLVISDFNGSMKMDNWKKINRIYWQVLRAWRLSMQGQGESQS